ncbi:hypothetical protein GGI07_004784 [Coemansia sp. Benny D115]|nr:hypothetical protein GGI07_004784 [Coemansia sp. Benny D115]
MSSLYRGAVRQTGGPALQRALVPAGPGSVRHHSQPREQHFAVTEFGLISNYVRTPLRHKPSIFSKAGIDSLKQQMVETVRYVFSLATIKYNLSGWNAKDFAVQAEDLYGLMNEAYAMGDLQTLKELCFPTMLSSLKNDIKRRNGRLEWRKVETLTPPRTVQVCCGRLTTDFTIGQVVVRIDQEQLIRPAGKARSASKPPKPVRVTEYVVFQRVVSDAKSPWRIYGKMDVPAWDMPPSSK